MRALLPAHLKHASPWAGSVLVAKARGEAGVSLAARTEQWPLQGKVRLLQHMPHPWAVSHLFKLVFPAEQSLHVPPLLRGPCGSLGNVGLTVRSLLSLTSSGPLLWTWEDPPWRSPRTWRLWLWIRTTTGLSSGRRCSPGTCWRVLCQVRWEPGHPRGWGWGGAAVEGLWVGQKPRISL